MKKIMILMLVFVSLFVSTCGIKNQECWECPQFAPLKPDSCKDGKIISGEIDECGCRGPPRCQMDSAPFEETTENYNIKYENGVVTYSVKIQKPTPCHMVIKDERVMESYPVQVYVDLYIRSSDDICIQVISEETIEGEVNVGHKPGSFVISLDNEMIYSTNLS